MPQGPQGFKGASGTNVSASDILVDWGSYTSNGSAIPVNINCPEIAAGDYVIFTARVATAPYTGPVPVVTAISAGVGFTIKLSGASDNNVQYRWFVIRAPSMTPTS